MFNVMRDFYLVHSNVFSLAILLLLLIIFLITKKNFRLMLVILSAFILLNVYCYHNTKNRVWERQFFVSDDYTHTYPFWNKLQDQKDTIEFKDSIVVKFAPGVKNLPWVLYDKNDNKKILHWCWVDEKWSAFANTDIVAWIWGDNKAKDMRKSSESRLNGDAK